VPRPTLPFSTCALLLLAPSIAAAQTTTYATPAELQKEGVSNLLELALMGQYVRVVDHAPAGLRDITTFDLRSRLHIGRTPSYCVGLDGQVGGSDEGVVYGLTGYLAGIGARWGAGNVVSLCGGGGFDRVGSVAPLAAKFPAELSIAVDLGPVRPRLWLRPSWSAGEDARRKTASADFVDQIEAGLVVRLTKQHRYWSRTTAGGGLAIGVAYRELAQTRAVGFFIGFDFAGER
jgi:hypothetical protein